MAIISCSHWTRRRAPNTLCHADCQNSEVSHGGMASAQACSPSCEISMGASCLLTDVMVLSSLCHCFGSFFINGSSCKYSKDFVFNHLFYHVRSCPLDSFPFVSLFSVNKHWHHHPVVCLGQCFSQSQVPQMFDNRLCTVALHLVWALVPRTHLPLPHNFHQPSRPAVSDVECSLPSAHTQMPLNWKFFPIPRPWPLIGSCNVMSSYSKAAARAHLHSQSCQPAGCQAAHIIGPPRLASGPGKNTDLSEVFDTATAKSIQSALPPRLTKLSCPSLSAMCRWNSCRSPLSL